MKILQVLIEHSVASLNHPYSYLCEDENVNVGFRVLISFKNQQIVGYVIKVINTSLSFEDLCKQDNIKYKYIEKVIDNKAIIDDELFNLAKHMENEYVTPLIKCLQTILPPSYKPASSSIDKIKLNTISKVIINKNIENEKLSNRQLEVYNDILLKNGILLKELPVGIINKLKEYNLVKVVQVDNEKDYFADYIKENKDVLLNDKQQQVYDEFINSNDLVYLLQGITGSGKTEVYIKLVKYYLSINKTAIILVPEISLTPMIIKRFKQHFDKIAILHGSLTKKEKQKQYDLIKDGKVNVVIGARSAIFAPLKNIGIIILDEEQSASYKQDISPTYHAKDIAIYRANYHKCKVLLGSATPSFESKARANKNVYHLLTLDKRANNQLLPKVKIVNMRDDVSDFSYLISNELDTAIKECLDNNEKIILLHNRRGYSPYVSCRKCGYIFKCPTCELSMSFHKFGNKFKCHYCNHEVTFNNTCPKCNSHDFLFMGTGTQKIEEVLQANYPKAKILRMDNDTTAIKNGHLNILNKFENEDYNILLGTQMVAKGLDFPFVTLVGVINADLSLAVADFRSAENTFELLTQVEGRTGRGNKEGKVIIQTYSPDSYVINLASKHDYNTFFTKEMGFRNKLKYPPFSYISTITTLASKSDQACILADKIFSYLRKNYEFELLGPAMPYIFKENDKIKVRIIIKAKDHNLMIKALNDINNTFLKESIERKVSIAFNIDTHQLL